MIQNNLYHECRELHLKAEGLRLCANGPNKTKEKIRAIRAVFTIRGIRD